MRIALINMPFANVQMPSIALTELKSRLEVIFGDRVSVDVLYLNQEFAKSLGIEYYVYLNSSFASHNSGLGDWFFRQLAFPDIKDNSEAYFRRYFPYPTKQIESLKQFILTKRIGLARFVDSLVDKYRLDQCDIVGFTSMFMQNVASFAMARVLKERNPDIVTIMGGANCETPMGQEIIRNVKQIDFVFSGPGLLSLPQFVESCLEDDNRNCHSIKGVFSKKNYIFQSGPDAIGEELNIDVPIELNYDAFLQEFEKNFSNTEIKPVLLFETSRGCWWGERAHCTFCGLNGTSMAYRAMDSDRAVAQFQGLFKYSDRVSRLEAVDNILPKSYLRDVLPRIETPPNICIFYEVKADLSEDDVGVLSKARVKSIQPGIESLATSTLKLMKKGTTCFQNLVLLKNCAKYEIEPTWNLLIGFPGEGADVYRKYIEDLPLLAHLPAPTGVYPVRFDRYSPYFVQAEHYKLELHPTDFYSMVYPFKDESLANMAYYFADTNLTSEYFLIMVRWIPKIREKIDLWNARRANQRDFPPTLCFKQNGSGPIVYDTRSGQVIEHKIDNNIRHLLECMDRPRRIEDMAKELGHLQDFDLARQVAWLQAKGLLFQEGDRFLSLVLPEEP